MSNKIKVFVCQVGINRVLLVIMFFFNTFVLRFAVRSPDVLSFEYPGQTKSSIFDVRDLIH